MTQPTLPTPQPSGVIFTSTPPMQLAVNASATLDAEAQYPINALNGNTAVKYSLSCGSPNACGTLTSSNEIGAIVYTAPAVIPSGGIVTITAISVADTSLSASAVITIIPPQPITVKFFSSVPASLMEGSNTQISAQITNDTTANPQVTWSVSCPSSDCGAFNPTATMSEGHTTYTAPSSIPSGGSVTITATSVTDTSKSASATIAIEPTAAQLADGTYVFQISGLNGNDASFTTGAFVAASGAIVSGEQDTVMNDGNYYSYFSKIAGGTYAPMPDGNIKISLNVPDSGPPEVFTGTMATGSHGFVAGVQGVVGMGTLERQSSTAAPAGGYAILLGGGSFFEQSPLIAGILNIDGTTTISGTGSILDVQQYYAAGGPVQLLQSPVAAPDSYGRAMFRLRLAPNTELGYDIYVAAYVVDVAHMRLVVAGDPNNSYYAPGDLGGLALGQGAQAGKFSAASVAGSSYVFAAEGRDGQGTLQMAGTCTLNADGSATGVLNWNDLSGGTAQSPQPFKGTFAVDPTGRITLSNLTDGANFNYSLHLYLDGSGGGFVLSNDVNDQFTGQAFKQQTSAFTAGTLSGRYGLSAGLYDEAPTWSYGLPMATGTLASAPNGSSNAITGYADGGNGAYDVAITGTLAADSSGVFQGQLTGLNGILNGTSGGPPPTPDSFTLYMVDSTQGVLIETDKSQLVLGRIQQVQ